MPSRSPPKRAGTFTWSRRAGCQAPAAPAAPPCLPPAPPPAAARRCSPRCGRRGRTHRRGVGRAAAGGQPRRLLLQLGQLGLAAPAPAPLQRSRLGPRRGPRSLGRRAAGAALLLGGGRRPLPRGELPRRAPLRHLRRQQSSAPRVAEATRIAPSSRGGKKNKWGGGGGGGSGTGGEKKKTKRGEKYNNLPPAPGAQVPDPSCWRPRS